MSDVETETGDRFAQSPTTGTIYRVTEWEDRGDGKIVSHQKEEVGPEDVPDERLCDYCESNLAVEWSDQGKRQCRECSPNDSLCETEGDDGSV